MLWASVIIKTKNSSQSTLYPSGVFSVIVMYWYNLNLTPSLVLLLLFSSQKLNYMLKGSPYRSGVSIQFATI